MGAGAPAFPPDCSAGGTTGTPPGVSGVPVGGSTRTGGLRVGWGLGVTPAGFGFDTTCRTV